MATAPYQLWIDLASVASASRAGSTVTITTSSEHGLNSDAYVQVSGTTGAAGTSMVGVYQITVTSGTEFTYTSAGTAGSATVDTAWIAVDVMNPPINYASGSNRQRALVVPLDSLRLSANGDGSGTSMDFVITQENTPPLGPWFLKIPDNARVRLCQKDTGATPASADVRFLGVVSSLSTSMNGSGQGTITNVTLGDANYLLDRVGVFGKAGAARTVSGTKFVVNTTTNVCTVTFGQAHGFKLGQPIQVGGVMQAGTAGGVTGIRRVKTIPNSKTITYDVNAGTTNTAQATNQVSYARINNRTDAIQITGRYQDLNLLDGDTITLGPSNGFTTELARLIRNTFSGKYVKRTGANTMEVTLPVPYAGVWGPFTGYGSISSKGYVSDVNINGQLLVTIAGGLTETQAVTELLSLTNAFHSSDAALLRTFNTADTSKIAGATDFKNVEAIQFPSTSLRSSLDTIVETYGGDAKERRYYVGLDGALNYNLVDPTAHPTYATAPYAIVTSGAGDPNTTSAKATVAANNLTVGYDHETTKNVMMVIPSTAGTPFTSILQYDEILDADGAQIFSTRSGPIFDDVIDYPTAVKNAGAQTQRASVAYFTERHKPMLFGEFTLRGAGTQSFNQFGFSAGYAQTGVGTYALVNRWEPGQWVEVTSAELGLSGLYRVEQVDWSLESGSYVQIITVRFNRKNPNDAAALLAQKVR